MNKWFIQPPPQMNISNTSQQNLANKKDSKFTLIRNSLGRISEALKKKIAG